MHNSNNEKEHCASEKLHRKLKSENDKSKSRYFKENVNEKSDNYRTNSNTVNKKDQFKGLLNNLKRMKRWLPEEVSFFPSSSSPNDQFFDYRKKISPIKNIYRPN
jgi:hypothetical protein